MTDGQVLEFSHVTKRFGALTAVDDLSARIEPGAVTAFLGPNGAGKTTSLRMMLGQIRPTSGTATVGGVPHAELRHPLRTIGSVLEEAVYRPRRTAPRQLTIAAKANGIPLSRVDEVLALVGLQNETETRIGAYSLGMRQRLSIAGALLGDPGALVLDEPANGLDPEGIRWMRLLMRRLADEGRTILVSSHVLSEIEQVADNVLVLAKGRLVYADSIGKLSDPTTGSVVVDADDREGLIAALRNAGLSFDVLRSGLTVHNTDAAAVGALAVSAGVALSTLQQRGPSLEEVFLDLVHGRRDPLTGAIPTVAAPAAAVPAAEGDPAAEVDAEHAGAEGSEAPAAEESEAPEGSESPETSEAPADAAGSEPVAGLFGAVAAAPVVAAAGAGAAALFGGSEAGGAPVPTTRREAAEFAAAQSAEAPESAEGEVSDATQVLPAVAEDANGTEESSDAESSEDATTPETGADNAGSEAPEAFEDAETADDAADDDGSDDDASDDDGSDDDAAEPEGEQDAGAEHQDAEHDGPSEDDGQFEHGGPSEPGDEESAEHGQDQDEYAEAAEQTPESADEATAIAAGVALTAPIDAPEYTPGQAPAEDEQATDDSSEQPAITRAPEGRSQGEALGSFETAELTVPDEARTVSFDELITGVPSAEDQSTEQGEHDAAEEQPGDGQGTSQDDAPTALIGTTPGGHDEGDGTSFASPEPSIETTEIAGIEIFAALAEGRTQEIQVILDETHDEDDDLAGEDVTKGEIHHDEDPRAAAVSASLAAAARAFYSDDAPSYTPAPAEEERSSDEAAPARDGQAHDGQAHDESNDERSGDQQSGDEQSGDQQSWQHEGDNDQEHHGH
ncbi:ATP-binding cassette domain-containing protein [Microbacterium sp. 22242]|uniref:ABC transporter ATP-binding protein n=1 Tax=Microbacterium sp. 22242 TaxID=3453896 RepID=UPI003F83DE57